MPSLYSAGQYIPYYSEKIITSNPDMSQITFFLSYIKLLKTGNKAHEDIAGEKNLKQTNMQMMTMRKRQKMCIFFFQCQNYAGQNSGEEEMRIPGWNGNQRQGKHRTFKALCISMEREKLNKSAY